MWIDVVFLLLLVMAVLRGIRHGVIIAVFSALAFLIGLAAAIKLSATVAGYLRDSMHMSTRWLPVLAFVLVFVGVVLLIRWGARLAEAAVDLAMMGWLNKLIGIVLYACVYSIAFSVLLFYARQVHIVSAPTFATSLTYPYIRSWGPAVIDEFGKFVTVFKGMFTELEDFFGHLQKGLQ